MKYLHIVLIAFLFLNCKNETSKAEVKTLTADEVVNKSIEVAGGDNYGNSILTFKFRDKTYKAKRNGGRFEFNRTFKDSLSVIKDVINNNGFQRYVDQIELHVSDGKIQSYSASVNSVHYFSVLPYGLNDKAVNKNLIGEERIKAKDYYKILVTFDQEGGGEDFEDVFIYWVNKATYKPDYLAYSYNEDDGKGMRFREAYNERYIKGLRFVDYNNYKSEAPEIKLQDLAKAFDSNQLKLLSKIELENVEVDLIDL
ncbi:DUF6503 family protein [uncultured Winogradskyella sp.]|uniref:DUF6503 family protein n=1 Tax=uncultured Winogradskyella sp. TaxID=395353 RepID=UPI00260AEA4F|nr:DUF6503 family protein [uncultured Winogradskyella sp.]